MICLNMIVKNEAHIIERCLYSVKDFIDCIAILDTGSTDNTIEKIKKFGETTNIPTYIETTEFTNFGESRNKALAMLYKIQPKFVFWIDADEILMGSKADKRNLKEDILANNSATSYLLLCKIGNIEYYRKQIFKYNFGFKWRGVLHEYIDSINDINCQKVSKIHTQITTNGNSHNNANKYIEHSKILLDDYEKTKSTRSLFYLAQSLENAGEDKAALKYYKQRYENLSGFNEERYVSGLRVYKKSNIILEGMFDFDRIELFYYAIFDKLDIDIKYCEHLAKIALEKILSNKWKTSVLFIEHEVYLWRLFDVIFLTGLRSKNFTLYTLSKVKLIEVIDSINEIDKNRILKNLQYDIKV